MSWRIVQADARSLPLDNGTVDLIVCSPPYWGLRSYRDDGEHYDGQIGSEATPQQFVDELVGMIDGEWRRVLKGSGSMFLNLGDKYAGSGGAGTTSGLGASPAAERGSSRVFPKGLDAARPKSLLGLPWRIALALIDKGWILRSEIIWSKPNGLPESVRDRVRRSHEQVFHFTLEPSYYSAVDEIREPHTRLWDESNGGSWAHASREDDPVRGAGFTHRGDGYPLPNPLGRLPGSVWTIPTRPLIVPEAHREHWNLPDHFAAFPPELVRRIVLGWSPEKVCARCGEGRRPVVERTPMRWTPSGRQDTTELRGPRPVSGRMDAPPETRILGEGCACATADSPTTPGVVLDPMCGTGTTVGVAHKLGRHGIGVDLSGDYCRLAEWRVQHSGHFDGVEGRTMSERQAVLL